MTKIKPALLEQTINEGRQDVIARRLLKLGDFEVRLTIKSDSYKFQSFARASLLQLAADMLEEVGVTIDRRELDEALSNAPGGEG